MSPAPTRRALVALATTAALLPAAPALAQTTTPTPTPSATPTPGATRSPAATPTPGAHPPHIHVDRNLIDFGVPHRLTVTGSAGAALRLFANGRQIRTVTIPGSGQFSWDLQPGERTQFSADVGGQRTPSVTVEVRRTVSIGIQQHTRGVYTFTGQIQRAEAGVQVTVARLDSESQRVNGVASTRTTADGRYEVRTSLPVGVAGYYALTGVNDSTLQAGRSRLYGLLVNTRPGTAGPGPTPTAQSLSLDVRRVGNGYVFEGRLTPGRGMVPVRLTRVVDGQLEEVAFGMTEADGRYIISIVPTPGTYYFHTVTADARSRLYGLVVPAAPARQPVVLR